jgi:hypothetical protein
MNFADKIAFFIGKMFTVFRCMNYSESVSALPTLKSFRGKERLGEYIFGYAYVFLLFV